MTEPNTTVTDGGAPAAAPTDPSVPVDATPAEAPADPADLASSLAAAGVLGGADLASHLGADSLDAHAAAQLAQGAADGTEAPFPPSAGGDNSGRAAVEAWLADPTYRHVFDVGSAAFELCTLCGHVVGKDFTDTHTGAHQAAGR